MKVEDLGQFNRCYLVDGYLAVLELNRRGLLGDRGGIGSAIRKEEGL